MSGFIKRKNCNTIVLVMMMVLISMVGATSALATTSLTSIDVTPSDPIVDIGQTQAFTATGIFSDSSRRVLSYGVRAIATGESLSCALLRDGRVQCWGGNEYGQLGDGTTTNYDPTYPPVTVSGISTATAVAAGEIHACAVLSDGTVKCWGNNENGQLGNGTTTDSSTPVTATGISNAVAIAASGYNTCALLATGTIRCWGSNAEGELGIGTDSGPETCVVSCSTTPVDVNDISSATAITAGDFHTCALLADGQMNCWGLMSMASWATE